MRADKKDDIGIETVKNSESHKETNTPAEIHPFFDHFFGPEKMYLSGLKFALFFLVISIIKNPVKTRSARPAGN